jgi:hypothetical protein
VKAAFAVKRHRRRTHRVSCDVVGSLRLVVAVAACASLGGCADAVFACEADDDCESGELGRCEANGFCSFPDEGCPTGRRYGEFAGSDLAGTCVLDEDTTSSSGPPLDDDGPITLDDDGPITLDDEGSTTMPPTSATTSVDDTTTGMPVTSVDSSGSSADGGIDPTTDGSEGSSESTGATPTMTMSFGDRDDADVQGVARDTFVVLGQPTVNNGAHADVHVAGNADAGATELSLLAFDLAALPDLPVVAAELRIWPYDVVAPGTIQVHRVVESWDEGTGDFSDGVCNWTDREPSTPWSTPGVGDGTYDDEVSAEFETPRPYEEIVVALPPELIEALREANGNDSLVLRSTDHSGTWFASREEPDATLRPLLVVTVQP